MSIRTKIRKFFLVNWRAKIICLICAVLVWLMVNHLLVREDSPEWDVDDIRLSLPE